MQSEPFVGYNEANQAIAAQDSYGLLEKPVAWGIILVLILLSGFFSIVIPLGKRNWSEKSSKEQSAFVVRSIFIGLSLLIGGYFVGYGLRVVSLPIYAKSFPDSSLFRYWVAWGLAFTVVWLLVQTGVVIGDAVEKKRLSVVGIAMGYAFAFIVGMLVAYVAKLYIECKLGINKKYMDVYHATQKYNADQVAQLSKHVSSVKAELEPIQKDLQQSQAILSIPNKTASQMSRAAQASKNLQQASSRLSQQQAGGFNSMFTSPVSSTYSSPIYPTSAPLF